MTSSEVSVFEAVAVSIEADDVGVVDDIGQQPTASHYVAH
jgi:hypothetical protein